MLMKLQALCQSKEIKDEKVCAFFALRSLTVGQILSSIIVPTDMCGMLLDGQEPLTQPVESDKAFQSRMVELTLGGCVGVI